MQSQIFSLINFFPRKLLFVNSSQKLITFVPLFTEKKLDILLLMGDLNDTL